MPNDVPKWEDTEEAIPSFDETEEITTDVQMSAPESDKPSALEGLISGSKIGEGDEIQPGGKLESALMGASNTLGLTNPLAPVSAHVAQLVAKGANAFGIGNKDVNDQIANQPLDEAARDIRNLNTEAQERNPVSYAGGSVLPTLGIPASAPMSAALGGIRGGADGFNKKGVEGIAPGAAIGAGSGLLLHGLFNVAGKVVGKGMEAGGKLVRRAEDKALGLSANDLSKFSVASGKSVPESAEKVVGTLRRAGIFKNGPGPEAIEKSMREIGENAQKNLTAAFQALDDSGARVPTADLLEQVDDLIATRANSLVPQPFAHES